METHGFSASSYDAPSYATMMGAVNPDFTVAGPNDWKPTVPASTTRTVSIAAGSGTACGVLGRTTAATTLTFGANSGSVNRFDYVIGRWNWALNDVVLMVLPGGTTPPAVNSSLSTNSALVNRIPGTVFDGVVAIVRVRPGVVQFNADDVTDVRAWPDFSGGVPALPMGKAWRSSTQFQAVPGSGEMTPGLTATRLNGGVTFSNGRLVVPRVGFVRIKAQVFFSNPLNEFARTAVYRNSEPAPIVFGQGWIGSYPDVTISASDDMIPVNPGDTFLLRAGAGGAGYIYGDIESHTFLQVQYVSYP